MSVPCMVLFCLLSLLVVATESGDPQPDTGFSCNALAENTQWPLYHIVNNITKVAGGRLYMYPLNDANAIFFYKGLYHVMFQAGGGNWNHVISSNLVHWKHIQRALGPAVHSSWDFQGPCDGTLSFPDLGTAVYNGSVPIIMYGPDCHQPIGAAVTMPDQRVGDAPRVNPARPRDPNDPMLREWLKTQPGPVKFDGVPCSFPGRVWKSKVGNYWNMLCSPSVGFPGWTRYTSTDPELLHWKITSESFTKGIDKAARAGAMFHKIPNSIVGGPTHMINAYDGSSFYLGVYDSGTETMTITEPSQRIDYGNAYHWAALGNLGPDPDADVGRVLMVSWIFGVVRRGDSHLSLVREILYDGETRQLISRPVDEYTQLHSRTLLSQTNVGPLPAAAIKTLDNISRTDGGALDIYVAFSVQGWKNAHKQFGISVRAPPQRNAIGPFNVTFTVSAPYANGSRTARVDFPQGVLGAMPASVSILPGETLDVRVLVDRSIVEVFVQGGRAVAVSVGAFDTTFTAVRLFNLDSTESIDTAEVSAYAMGCGWTDAMQESFLNPDGAMMV